MASQSLKQDVKIKLTGYKKSPQKQPTLGLMTDLGLIALLLVN